MALLLLSFPKWGNWGIEKLHDFPEVTQPDLRTVSIMTALSGCWASAQSPWWGPHHDGAPTPNAPVIHRSRSAGGLVSLRDCSTLMGFRVCNHFMTHSYQNEGPRLLTGAKLAGLPTAHLLWRAPTLQFLFLPASFLPTSAPLPTSGGVSSPIL